MKSTLMRNLMDNMYNQNFGRYAVLEGQANLDDLLTQRPGGVVRVKSPNAVMPLATPAPRKLLFPDVGIPRWGKGVQSWCLTSMSHRD